MNLGKREYLFLKKPYALFRLGTDAFLASDSRLYRVNETAYFILALLRGGATRDSLTDCLTRAYGETAETVLNDILGFLAILGGMTAIVLRQGRQKAAASPFRLSQYAPPELHPLCRPISCRGRNFTIVGGRPRYALTK